METGSKSMDSLICTLDSEIIELIVGHIDDKQDALNFTGAMLKTKFSGTEDIIGLKRKELLKPLDDLVENYITKKGKKIEPIIKAQAEAFERHKSGHYCNACFFRFHTFYKKEDDDNQYCTLCIMNITQCHCSRRAFLSVKVSGWGLPKECYLKCGSGPDNFPNTCTLSIPLTKLDLPHRTPQIEFGNVGSFRKNKKPRTF